jgi:hypothetical protein
MVQALVQLHHAEGYLFDASQARLRCLPHTIHLSALQLLKGVGVFRRSRQKANSYQNSVTAPIDRSFDEDVGDDADEDEMPELEPLADTNEDELSISVGKVDIESDSDESTY